MTENELKILCPYCGEPYSAEMIFDLSASATYNTFGPDDGAEISGKIEIKCTHCNKIIYVKEYTPY